MEENNTKDNGFSEQQLQNEQKMAQSVSENPKIEQMKSRSDRMGNVPIGKLLFSMSIPAILSMLVQALYNIVDTLFVAGYSTSVYGSSVGTAAISAVMPLQFLITGMAVGIGVGTNVMISKRLGEGKREDANQFARHGLVISLCACVVFFTMSFFICQPFMSLFSGGDELMEELGTTYITICMMFSFGVFIEIMLSKTLQSTGSMKIPMVSQLIGAITNIILDPLLIYGIGFFPELGVAGAAVATVTGQITAMCFMVTMYIVKTHEVSVNLKKIKFKAKNFVMIAMIGLPTFVMNMAMSIMLMMLNLILIVYENGIAILGIYYKMQSFVFMPAFGLMQGLMPILSYNYGANNKKRYVQALKLALFFTILIMVAGTILFVFGGELIMKMFSASGDYMTNGAYALRIMSLAFLFAGFGIVFATSMQAVGMGVISLMLSFMRQVVLVVPLAIVISNVFGFMGVWFAYPLSELIANIIFAPICIHYINKNFNRMNGSKLTSKVTFIKDKV